MGVCWFGEGVSLGLRGAGRACLGRQVHYSLLLPHPRISGALQTRAIFPRYLIKKKESVAYSCPVSAVGVFLLSGSRDRHLRAASLFCTHSCGPMQTGL